MTVKELYDYAKERNAENYDIEVFNCDDGGYYPGTRTASFDEIEVVDNLNEIHI